MMTSDKNQYLLQPYQISRAIYRCDTLERKLLFYAALLVQKQTRQDARERYIAKFSIHEFLKNLGMAYTTSMREYIKTAVKTIATNTIILRETDTYLNVITWLQQGIYDEDDGTISILFSEPIGELFYRCRSQFCLINPRVMGSLKSYYAMRYYELALSYAGFSGKNGNKPNTWYFDYTLSDLRELFSVKGYNNTYGTQNFIKKIVETPLKELNATNPDFKISVEKIKDENDGRKLAGIRFICKKTSRKRKTTGEKMRIQLEKDAAETANAYSAYLAQGGDLMQCVGGI